MSTIGEQEITKQQMQKQAPDVVSKNGQQQLVAKRVAAGRVKNIMDQALQVAAQKIGGTSSSRVKDLDTMQKKIVQKRMQGRDYNIEDINDAFGGRLVVEKENIPLAKKEVQVMSKAGLFEIMKEEDVKSGEYHAYHYDIKTPDGNRGELQIHTPSSEAESIANHDIRAKQGEKPDPQWEEIQKIQHRLIQAMPSDKARAVSDALQSLHKINDNKPIDPAITARVVAVAGGGV